MRHDPRAALLTVPLDRSSDRPLYGQIHTGVRDAVLSKRTVDIPKMEITPANVQIVRDAFHDKREQPYRAVPEGTLADSAGT